MNLIRNRWMFVPVALLGLSVTTAALTVTLAVRGHALGVEPDYYEKSRAWNDVRIQLDANERLGWVVTPDFSPGASGHAHLSLSIKDKHGIPIPAGKVSVEAIPLANADRRVNLDLALQREGEFATDVPLRVGGQWEFRVRVERGEECYTDSFRRTLEVSRTNVPGGSDGSTGGAP